MWAGTHFGAPVAIKVPHEECEPETVWREIKIMRYVHIHIVRALNVDLLRTAM